MDRSSHAANPDLRIPDAAIIGGVSPAARALQRVIADLAGTETPLLILGERGSGKKTVAALVHTLSRLRHEPLTIVDCNTEGDSFFHVETVSDDGTKPARYSRRGTIVLQDVTELSKAAQLGLLKDVLNSPATTVRLISTTSESLDEAVRSGAFREELYYRISGMHLRVPPLRNRKEDIPIMVQWFLQKHSHLSKFGSASISPEILRYLIEYSWPGNIAQLDEVIRSIVISGDEQASLALLAPNVPPPDAWQGATVSLRDYVRSASRQTERRLILQALTRTHWNKKKAAQELHISYKALLYKLKEIGDHDNPTVTGDSA